MTRRARTAWHSRTRRRWRAHMTTARAPRRRGGIHALAPVKQQPTRASTATGHRHTGSARIVCASRIGMCASPTPSELNQGGELASSKAIDRAFLRVAAERVRPLISEPVLTRGLIDLTDYYSSINWLNVTVLGRSLRRAEYN